MRILVATDSFKDALAASAVCAAIARGLRQRDRNAVVIEHPLADGGEGTLDILTSHLNLRLIAIEAVDPLGRPHRTHYGMSADGHTAYIELATISGLQLLASDERNPSRTTTFGAGQLIQDAINHGATTIVLTIGGSATNDAGIGLLAALGWRFLDANGDSLEPTGDRLPAIDRIVFPAALSLPAIDILSDVTNPLFGPNGAAYVYARQKGANEKTLSALDAGLRHFSEVTERIVREPVSPDTAGAGAAGGVGYAALNYLRAKMHSGIEYVLDATRFDSVLTNVDFVITGEGHLDAQTLQGKVVHGVCRHAARRGVPVIALCGKLTATPDQLRAIGVQDAYCINSGTDSLSAQLAHTADRLAATAAGLALSA